MTDAAPNSTTQPSRAARLLTLVRKLVDYGKQLAASLRQPSATADLESVSRGFGTREISLILARIARGLLLANALEDRLIRGAVHLDAQPRSPATSATPKPPRAPAAQPNARLADLPTAEQIAADIRRRPIGAVVADICRDLGIRPCHPLWRELQWAVIRYWGNYARLVKDTIDRSLSLAFRDDTGAKMMAPPQPVSPAGTGPP